MLIVSSAEIYGPVNVEDLPVTEDAPLRPTSPYSVSKIAQDMLGLQYFLSHNIPIFRVRAFNHIGPGQNQRFVAPDFALQIARIEAGQVLPVIAVGDLTAQRDFTDVRDIVRAYRMIVEHGNPGDVYNVCSGKARSIQSLLDRLLVHSTARISVEVDPDRLRPASLPILLGDNTRLRKATGWQPRIAFDQTLRDVLDDCRQRIRQR
jgi:GDP-4-dehydro-6-deoxy-D-mannose reductase